MFASISEFIGHLHPVLVHLPIGILLLACLFLWQSRRDKSDNLQKTIQIILGLGMVSAIASCITGYILSGTGDYDEDMVDWHQWMGISVAFVSIIAFYFRRKKSLQKWQSLLATFLLILILITGHLGGSLTHGSDYLTQPLLDTGEDSVLTAVKPIPNAQEAFLYPDIIQPILQRKCYTCHGRSRQKGKLRLDNPELIMKGGKDGAVIVAGKPGESELIKRIFLAKEEEHHMAPKEKPQLTESEKNLLRWWVEQGANFTKKVKEFQQTDKIKLALTNLQKTSENITPPDIPTAPVEKADEAAISRIRKLGAVIQPVSQNSNYLEANFITSYALKDADLALLIPIKKQLVWLKLSGHPLTDSALFWIGQCSQLIRLNLDHTQISDKGLPILKSLDQLRVLNLVGTRVTSAGLMNLTTLKNLKALYLYQTGVDKNDWLKLKKSFPGTLLDSGGYAVPLFPNDTVIVKPPKRPA